MSPSRRPDTLAIKLTPDAERILKHQKHPWIFSDSVVKINKRGTPGDIAIIYGSKKNKVIGVGLFDPDSPISIKMLHFGSSVIINDEFFRHNIEKAFSVRKELLTTKTNSYRLIFGENDAFPGLIADVYAEVLVIKLYAVIWIPYLRILVNQLVAVSGCKTAVLRLSRNLQSMPDLEVKEGEILFGTLKNEEVAFLEHGLHFVANVLQGHKTGFFLDHRQNRKKVGLYARGRKVLDVFSYAGGFTVHALAGGASEVNSVDISEQALDTAATNVKLNSGKGKHFSVRGDAFEVLDSFIRKKKLFDLVVIDPPSFVKSKSELAFAARKYAQLASLGAGLVAKDGILVLASCSSRMDQEEFFRINQEALSKAGRAFRLIEKTFHDIDHPVTFKEGAYLKCGYYLFR